MEEDGDEAADDGGWARKEIIWRLAGIPSPCQCSRMSMILEVPDEIQRALRVPVPERQSRLLAELACALYQREILSFGKAAELSRLSQFRFGQELVERGIARHYADEDIAEDVAYAGGQ